MDCRRQPTAFQAEGAGGTIVYNEKFYWIGGLKNRHLGKHRDYFDEYDPLTRKWSIMPDAPRKRDHSEAALYNEKVYLAGGRRTKATYVTFKVVIPEKDVFDFYDWKWNTLDKKLSTPKAGASSLIWKVYLLIAGGEEPFCNYASPIVEGLQLQKFEWSTFTKWPEGRHGAALISHNKKLYLSCDKIAKKEESEIGDLWLYENQLYK